MLCKLAIEKQFKVPRSMFKVESENPAPSLEFERQSSHAADIADER
jgi:hypothetical protein